ncbi:MAG TPA: hypothetical protein PKW94_00035 [Candidatus Dojkabacteria bacterium]|nr:hypothetical protein [Candidatus Dojkabacteria bacterium]HOF78757.1 hypothetical protein [Candidatus Dojkabacteria bacterium]HOR05777.1 hypothetical protein [Candidatus Dojkabacteria bacterium]HOT60684.1 hypothetical protein [Candidatus Dojkabacteria bacterium]HQI92435.1 hypothetical protein [Candidatus Dojkabacteria bacterium]
MEMLKKAIIALILLGVVVLAWVGGSIYYQNTNIEVSPNAQEYTKTLRDSFDLEELEKITERTENSFPVSPSEFTVLIQGN